MLDLLIVLPEMLLLILHWLLDQAVQLVEQGEPLALLTLVHEESQSELVSDAGNQVFTRFLTLLQVLKCKVCAMRYVLTFQVFLWEFLGEDVHVSSVLFRLVVCNQILALRDLGMEVDQGTTVLLASLFSLLQ